VILLHFPHFVDHRLWVVLGVPRSLGELKRRLTQAVIECFTDTDIGSLYYAVRQLAEFGLLTAVGHQRVARGGLRTVYRITPRGRDRFRELLHAHFAAEGDLRKTLYGPMLF